MVDDGLAELAAAARRELARVYGSTSIEYQQPLPMTDREQHRYDELAECRRSRTAKESTEREQRRDHA